MDNQSEEVMHFLLSLVLDPDGSILELDGKQLLRIAKIDSAPLEQGDVASVQRGIAQMEAGMGRLLDDVDADIRKSLGFKPLR